MQLNHNQPFPARQVRHYLDRLLVRTPVTGLAAHQVIVPAFLGTEPKFYSIDLVFAPDRKSYKFRYARHVHHYTPKAPPVTPRIKIGGSGVPYLLQDRSWVQKLLHLIRANDRGKIWPGTVADYLAALNFDVHQALPDKSVGPRCIVAWRYRKGGVRKKGGGGHRFYSGIKQDANSPVLPTIMVGRDVRAILGIVMPHIEEIAKAAQEGEPVPDGSKDEIVDALNVLPVDPDEKLR